MNLTSTESGVRDRVRSLLEYLVEYSRLKTPPKRELGEYAWHLSLTNLPAHPAVELFLEPPEDAEERVLLRVARPELKACPQPPGILRPWLRPGWEAFDKESAFLVHPSEIKTSSEVEEPEDPEDPEDEEFEHPPEVLEAFESWSQVRKAWRVEEVPARQANQLFDRLFSLKSTLEREGERYAIALGAGILRWRTNGEERVEHHLLSQRCSLVFDAKIPRFSIAFTDDSMEFPTNLLGDLADIDRSGLGALVEQVRQGDFDILSADADTFLTGLARRLWSQGEYYDRPLADVPKGKPTVQKAPVLLLEPRGRGYVEAAQHLLMNLDEFEPPSALRDLVGLPREALGEGEGRKAAGSLPLLFTKPTNLEQERVARRLAANGSVLVQGPPGTGKTHTIANLIGHLLAQGKSILVTSHTSKALTVVREKVEPELRGLCVSVLDDGKKGQQELASAVMSITNKLTETTADELGVEAERLRSRRGTLEAELEKARGQLISAHRSEYETLTVGGQSVQPSEAARKLKEWRGQHDWLPGKVSLGEPCPLSEAEVQELYRIQSELSAQEEDLISAGLPSTSALLAPQDFQQLCSRGAELLAQGVEQHADLWTGEPDGAELRRLQNEAERLVAVLDPGESWLNECRAAGQNPQEASLWEELCYLVDETQGVVNAHRSVVLNMGPQIEAPEMPLRRQIEVCNEILIELKANNGKLGFFARLFKKEWTYFRGCCTVDGHSPERLEDYEAIASQLKIQAAREGLLARWERQTQGLGCPRLRAGDPERQASELAQKIREALGWNAEWESLEKALQQAGFHWLKLFQAQPSPAGDQGGLMRRRDAVVGPLKEAFEAKLRAYELEGIRGELSGYHAGLSTMSESPLISAFMKSLEERDPERYAKAFRLLGVLEHKRAKAAQRVTLLERLSAAAPEWAKQIDQRSGPHGEAEAPGPMREAWLYAQWRQQLRQRHRLDLDKLQEKVTGLKEELRSCTSRYVEALTWKYQAERTGNAQRQALVGWMQLVKRIGKGTGKQAGALKALARERLKECREAVPVWILPFSKVVESYRPGEVMFDVVIVDEASQADVTGLLALTLGREMVVVGDHEQVSPSAIGEKADQVMALTQEHLQSIPNRELFDGKSSVYDMAQRSFGETIRLKEHFRCVPEIIAFSNQLCYDGEIQPLRESESVLVPAVVSHRVPEGQRMGRAKVNDAEAKEIASLIAACIEHPRYKGKTFGVISLVGVEQADLVQQYLMARLDMQSLEERRILCGNAAQFQGDERDVIFLSMVDSPTGTGPLRLVGGHKGIVQRYNVAASRAKDQMWVVHSLNPAADLKAEDIRLQLIKAADYSVVEEVTKLKAKTESVFEAEVLERLVKAGYRVKPQLPIGAYRVDMVVIGENRRVAIECDGDAYHPPEQLEADLARQEILERVGNLTFIRIRGSAYFQDPEATMRGVFQRLQDLRVEKLGPEQEAPTDRAPELREEIVRRASEFRNKWWPPEEPDEEDDDEDYEDGV